jgi:hypothetical protein
LIEAPCLSKGLRTLKASGGDERAQVAKG